ncbi:hypothetical protein VPHD433_0149 [Vibrio phage D433]
MENQEEKVLWIYEVGHQDRGRWNTKEDYSGYELLSTEAIPEPEASALLWEHQQNVAESYGEPDWEDCSACSGEPGNEECGDCGGDGGWSDDYSEFVEKNSYGKLEEYDPTMHYMVNTGFPENVKYKRERKLENLACSVTSGERGIENLQKELARIGRLIAEKKTKLTNDRLELMKMENE